MSDYPENCDRSNLRAWCQRCHNTYDMPMRRRGIAARAREALGVADMFAPAALIKPQEDDAVETPPGGKP